MKDVTHAGTYSEEFVDWALSFRPEELPDDVRQDLTLRLLDHLGLCLVGSAYGFGERAAAALAPAFGRTSTVPGSGSTIVGSSGSHAEAVSAFTNAVNAHAHDFDDTHLEAVAHCSSVILSSALAVGEAAGVSWGDFLVGAAAGYELMIRLGLVAPGHLVSHGFHPTSIQGTFGSALTSSLLRGASRETALDGLGIAGSLASGILQTVVEGTDTKRLHTGWAAMSGILANRFAESKYSGPREIIEGRMGLFATHVVDPDVLAPERLVDALGQRWELLSAVTKPFPCCHLNHAFIESALDLRSREDFRLDDIERVTCFIAEDAASLICEPWEHKARPRDSYEAKFSLPFSVAVALVDGAVTVGTYRPESLARVDLAGIIQRIGYEHDDASSHPKTYPGKICLRMRDGREQYSETLVNLGGLERPLSREQVEDKFRENAAERGLTDSYACGVIKALFDMDISDPIALITERLAVLPDA